jgi:hypothetical protein
MVKIYRERAAKLLATKHLPMSIRVPQICIELSRNRTLFLAERDQRLPYWDMNHSHYICKKIWPLKIIFSYFNLPPSNYQRSAPVNHKKILSFQKSFTFPLRIRRRYHRGYWQFCRTLFERIALGCWKVQGTNHDPGGQERLNVFCNVSCSPWTQWRWSYSQLHPSPTVYL